MQKKYDYYVAGRWRNRDAIQEVVQILREIGYSVYCFFENPCEGDGIFIQTDEQTDPEMMMKSFESLPNWRKIQHFVRFLKRIWEL
jgi:hypothetical protein